MSTKQIIVVVSEGEKHEESTIVGVYSTFKLAEEAALKIVTWKSKNNTRKTYTRKTSCYWEGGCDYIDISSFIVDDDQSAQK